MIELLDPFITYGVILAAAVGFIWRVHALAGQANRRADIALSKTDKLDDQLDRVEKECAVTTAVHDEKIARIERDLRDLKYKGQGGG